MYATTEDVFHLYERNKLVYLNECTKSESCCRKYCFCYLDEAVQPITIGDQFVPCKLSTKCYVNPGEECPICLEKIMMKKEAFLTGCGHAFHRHCLFKTFETKWKTVSHTTLRCPLCRCALGFPNLLERYSMSPFQMNYLDILENFWITKDYIMPHYCYNRLLNPHYLGTLHKTCKKCKEYVKYG